jgi:hypothetical protein
MTEQDTAHWYLKVKEPLPKSATYFLNILEKKMAGEETPPLPGHKGILCQGRGQVSSPAHDDHEC